MYKLDANSIKCYTNYFNYNAPIYNALSIEEISRLRDEWERDIHILQKEAFPIGDYYPYSSSLEHHPSPTTAIVSLNDEIDTKAQVGDILDWLIEQQDKCEEEITVMKEALLLNRRKELRKIVDSKALATLSPVEGDIYKDFMAGMIQSDIARKRNISRQRVSEAMALVVLKLKRGINDETILP